LTTYAILSDLQGYKVDQRAWSATLHALGELKPDVIILAGDIVDFDDISKYRKKPDERVRLDRECKFVREKILEALMQQVYGRKRSGSRVVYLEGNHEDRLQRYLMDRAPELWGSMLTTPELLQLKGFGIEWWGKKPYWINSHLVVVHGHLTRKWSGHAARALLQEYKCSVIMGHGHRMGAYYESGANGREWVGIENGHLMDLRKADYVAGIPNWQAGWTWVTAHPGGLFHVEHAKIIKGKCLFRDRIWKP